VRFFRRRCKNLPQAEDLAQDVIVRTLGRAQWTSEDQAQGYLFRTATNLWRDQIRHTRVGGGAELNWDEDLVSAASAAAVGTCDTAREADLRRGLESLRITD
jgi:DNA-directed RNA polymerase specialized sigma24 family protein